MTNLQLFDLINAGPGLGALPRGIAVFIANWLSDLIGVGLVVALIRGDVARRLDVLEMVAGMLLALAISHVIGHLWPEPRPFVLGLGTQYIPHGNDPGMPSHHVSSMWGLALTALATHRMKIWGLLLLAAGLLVGWARVFLGVHFPFDVLAAFPVALLGALATHGARLLWEQRFPNRRPPSRASGSVRYEG